MKFFKNSLQELREIFDRSICVRDIAEPLASFDSSQPATQIRDYLEKIDFDVVGVRVDGVINGFARKIDLSSGMIGEYVVEFSEANVLAERAPLLHLLEVMRHHPQVFVIIKDQVWGIVTRGDLQKGPVRMWLFGIISLIEMNFLKLIRRCYPNSSWKDLVNPNRMNNAEYMLRDRKQRNEATDLADCLQFCDKAHIILNTENLIEELGIKSKKKAKQIVEKLENLRNELAHSQDILTGKWPEICDLAAIAENILIKCEELNAAKECSLQT